MNVDVERREPGRGSSPSTGPRSATRSTGPLRPRLADAFRAFDANAHLRPSRVLTGGGRHVLRGAADLKAIGEDAGNVVTADGDGPMGPTRMMLSKPVIAAGRRLRGRGRTRARALVRPAGRGGATRWFGVFCRRWGKSRSSTAGRCACPASSVIRTRWI